jgi:hypothetical protein
METTFNSIRGQRGHGRQAILRVKECLNGWNISASPHRADLRHSIPLVQGGQASEFLAAVESKGGLPDILVAGE